MWTDFVSISLPSFTRKADGSVNANNVPLLSDMMLDAVGARADRVIGGLRAGGNVLLFGHREILRILAVRWIGLAPIEGRRLLLATASLSVLGYDHDLNEPVIHAWNGRPTAVAAAQ